MERIYSQEIPGHRKLEHQEIAENRTKTDPDPNPLSHTFSDHRKQKQSIRHWMERERGRLNGFGGRKGGREEGVPGLVVGMPSRKHWNAFDG